MEKPTRKYWFPAKTFGWGWGVPATWQGWGVLVGYFASIGILLLGIDAQKNLVGFVAGGVLLTLILAAVCYAKGEPPRWRWGK